VALRLKFFDVSLSSLEVDHSPPTGEAAAFSAVYDDYTKQPIASFAMSDNGLITSATLDGLPGAFEATTGED
jgi:hypothetical protein